MPRRFVDLVEVNGLWCDPAEADKVRAAEPALDDLTKATRRRTPAEIPELGTPVEFWAFVLCLLAAGYLFG